VGKAGFKLDNWKTDLHKKTCGTPCVEKKLDVNIPLACSQGPHTSAQMPKSDSTPDSPKQLKNKETGHHYDCSVPQIYLQQRSICITAHA
jgi:hypothetical protein